MTNPPITTVGFSFEEMGKTIVTILFDRLGDAEAKPIQVTIPAKLIIRNSTNPTKEKSEKDNVQNNIKPRNAGSCCSIQ
jgi:hypothetical protein